MAGPHRHGAGGPASIASPVAPRPPQPAPSSSQGTSPLDAISGAWAGFLGSAVSASQVALGTALLAVSLLILVSQTSAGGAAGRAAVGGARRAARLIPGVGAIA